MDCECNVCLHGECYACLVGVATGPESHDTHCPARGRMFTEDGRVRGANPTRHRIHTRFEGERAYWECSCGAAGNCAEDRAGMSCAAHIDYAAGEHRVDTSQAF